MKTMRGHRNKARRPRDPYDRDPDNATPTDLRKHLSGSFFISTDGLFVSFPRRTHILQQEGEWNNVCYNTVSPCQSA